MGLAGPFGPFNREEKMLQLSRQLEAAKKQLDVAKNPHEQKAARLEIERLEQLIKELEDSPPTSGPF